MPPDDPDASALGRLSRQQQPGTVSGADAADDSLEAMYNRYPPVERWLRNRIYGTTPDIPSPPSTASSPVSADRPAPGQPQSLHDYRAMARRPLSPNVEDRRFEQSSNPWLVMLKYMNRRGTQPQQPQQPQQAPNQMPKQFPE